MKTKVPEHVTPCIVYWGSIDEREHDDNLISLNIVLHSTPPPLFSMGGAARVVLHWSLQQTDHIETQRKEEEEEGVLVHQSESRTLLKTPQLGVRMRRRTKMLVNRAIMRRTTYYLCSSGSLKLFFSLQVETERKPKL